MADRRIHIEHHPENGDHPHVVITEDGKGMRLWFACRTIEEAEIKRAESQDAALFP